MTYKDYKIFNLLERRPQVLLFGNGIVRNDNEDMRWERLIQSIARDGIDVSEYRDVPYTIQATAVADMGDTKRHQKYEDKLTKAAYRKNSLVNALLTVPFDAILSTNYTYELEYHMLSQYPELSKHAKLKYSHWTIDKRDSKYLIHGFNRLKKDGVAQDIWHIHGETRRPTSLILTHDEYARLISRILLYNKERKKDYLDYENEMHFKSWIDYFILGDLYILGQGLDFSEFDLWWLLNRRLRENNVETGKVIFYEPKTKRAETKTSVLKALDVECEHCGITIEPNCLKADAFYKDFYIRAISDIRRRMSDRKV